MNTEGKSAPAAGDANGGAGCHPPGNPPVVLLAAQSGTGKTSVCRRLAADAKARGLLTAGILSLAVQDDGEKRGIALRSIGSGESHLLATKCNGDEAPDVGTWKFVADTVAWGNAILAQIPICDLLVIDEIGPLELFSGKGITGFLDVLRKGQYRLAVVTVRPALADVLSGKLPDLNVRVFRMTVETREMIRQELFELLAGKDDAEG